jgi:hypothetical protein
MPVAFRVLSTASYIDQKSFAFSETLKANRYWLLW